MTNAWRPSLHAPGAGAFFLIGAQDGLSAAAWRKHAEDRFLEHQFGARPHRAGRAADRRAAARHPVPAGNQGARRHLPGRAVPPPRLRPSPAQRPAHAPRRRDPQPRAAARIPASTTGRTMARRATSACGSNAGSGSRMSMCPPAATCRTATLNPKFGQKLDFIERMTRWSESSARADDHRRRFQRRAARMRRLEPQAAAQRRQPHAGRGRGADPAAARRTTGSTSAASSSPRRSAASPGGAIARPTGRRTTAAAGSTICGRRPSSPATSRRIEVLEPCRNWERPSDHVPLICEIEV